MKVSICKKCKSYSQDEFECYVGRMQRKSKFCDLFIKKESVKTMNREEAVLFLIGNRERRVRYIKDFQGKRIPSKDMPLVGVSCAGLLVDSNDDYMTLVIEDDKAEFEVVRELRKMSFGEAVWHFYNKDMCVNEVVSCETGRCYSSTDESDLHKEELVGLWTVVNEYE